MTVAMQVERPLVLFVPAFKCKMAQGRLETANTDFLVPNTLAFWLEPIMIPADQQDVLTPHPIKKRPCFIGVSEAEIPQGNQGVPRAYLPIDDVQHPFSVVLPIRELAALRQFRYPTMKKMQV